jgi:hypothetical protein
LTVAESGALCAVAEEKLARATRHREVYQVMTRQGRISRGQDAATRRGRGLPIEEDHQAHATLQRLGPHHGGRQMHRGLVLPGAEVLETAQVLAGPLAVICAPCPAALRMRTGGAQQAGGGAPPFGAGVQLEADACIHRWLFRLVAGHTRLVEAWRQAMPMRTQLLPGEGEPGGFPLSPYGVLSRRRRRTGERQSAPACDIQHREGGHRPPACGTTRAAMAAVPEPERLLPPRGDAGRIMRREQCRVRGKRCHEHTLMQVGPGKWRPKRPCDGTLSLGAVAPQVAEGDATAEHKDRDEQRGQELPRGWPEAGHLLQDVVDHWPKPFHQGKWEWDAITTLNQSVASVVNPFRSKNVRSIDF